MKTHKMVLAALFVALTAIGAFIKIPLGLTYITLQFFFTAMAGILLGAKWGAASQGVYVLLGLMGIPIFTQGGGPAYVLTPTCGFLFGLILSAFVIGKITEGGQSAGRIAAACLAGLGVLYAVGLPYMYLILNLYLDRALSFAYVAKAGMLVYLPGDFLKIAAAVVLSRKLIPILRKQ